MIRGARYLYATLAWAFVAGILLQVYFIGLGLFSSPDYNETHTTFGWILHTAAPVLLLAAALARPGRTWILATAALVVLTFFVPILAAVRADLPLAAAFHPVGATVMFVLAIVVARGATSVARSTDLETRTTLAEWAIVAVIVVIYLFLSLSGGPQA